MTQAIQAQLAGAKLGQITSYYEDGETNYDVEAMADGRSRSFTFSEAGEMTDKEVFIHELSPGLQKAIRRHAGKARLKEITWCKDDGEVTYDVELMKAGKSRIFTLAEDGKLLEEEVLLEELPEAVREAARLEAGKDQIGEIYRAYDEDGTAYDVDFAASGKTRSATFDEKGVRLYTEESLTLPELPAAVTQTLKSKLGDGRLCGVYKTIEDGEVTYDADMMKNGKREFLSITSEGRIAEATKE